MYHPHPYAYARLHSGRRVGQFAHNASISLAHMNPRRSIWHNAIRLTSPEQGSALILSMLRWQDVVPYLGGPHLDIWIASQVNRRLERCLEIGYSCPVARLRLASLRVHSENWIRMAASMLMASIRQSFD